MAEWSGVAGKRVVITGATSGIGLAAAQALAALGAKLTIVADIGVSSAVRISAAEATSSESTSPLRCCTTAGIGLALTA